MTGLMWILLSWIIQHWVGLFHTLRRTALVVLLWYLLPDHRFMAIPFAIVLVYAASIIILRARTPPKLAPE